MPSEEWTNAEHVRRYFDRADQYPRRGDGDSVLLENVPRDARRILDLGTGDGRLLALLSVGRPKMCGVGLDFSEPMLEAAHRRFADDERIEFVKHDLDHPLPELGRFDAVVSSFAIHHLEHERKRSLYREVFDLLEPGGVFGNLEHVASPTHRLHVAFYAAIDEPLDEEDPSDRLLDVETQLGWLRAIGFEDVDCYWKWLEMALLLGVKPTVERLATAALEDGLADIRRAPRDAGTVELIVRRPAPEEREVVAEAQLDPAAGLVGDCWLERGSRATEDGSAHPDMQLTMMSARAVALIARTRERWPLAGDQLYVDLDLSAENLPPGTLLRVGTATIEITGKPHTGCGKFLRRFGVDAMRFVNTQVGRELNLRGIYARVVSAGTVRTGDPIHKAAP